MLVFLVRNWRQKLSGLSLRLIAWAATFGPEQQIRGEIDGMYWGMEWHAIRKQPPSNGRLCIFYTEPDNVRRTSSKPNLAATI